MCPAVTMFQPFNGANLLDHLDMVSKMPDLRPNLRRKKCKKRKFFIVKFFFDITLRNIRNLPNFLHSF